MFHFLIFLFVVYVIVDYITDGKIEEPDKEGNEDDDRKFLNGFHNGDSDNQIRELREKISRLKRKRDRTDINDYGIISEMKTGMTTTAK